MNYGIYEKDYFKVQKLIILMPYFFGVNEGGDENRLMNV